MPAMRALGRLTRSMRRRRRLRRGWGVGECRFCGLCGGFLHLRARKGWRLGLRCRCCLGRQGHCCWGCCVWSRRRSRYVSLRDVIWENGILTRSLVSASKSFSFNNILQDDQLVACSMHLPRLRIHASSLYTIGNAFDEKHITPHACTASRGELPINAFPRLMYPPCTYEPCLPSPQLQVSCVNAAGRRSQAL
jgi:hypothetical protein